VIAGDATNRPPVAGGLVGGHVAPAPVDAAATPLLNALARVQAANAALAALQEELAKFQRAHEVRTNLGPVYVGKPEDRAGLDAERLRIIRAYDEALKEFHAALSAWAALT